EKIRNHLEEEIKKRTQEIELRNQELEAFNYSVSHDLRAPLRAISGYSDILKEDYFELLDEEGKRVISIINNNVLKMHQLINEILKFSRLTRLNISKTNLKMKALFTESFQKLLQLEPPTRKIEFHIEDVPDAHGDYTMISQLITNLMSNAIKYTRPKTKTLIEVGSKRFNGQLAYFVKDNGVGFDMQYKNKLFGVFQRLHKDSEFEGTGVGLAIVQRVIHKHNGHVWGEGQVDQGATFYFTLP
ncbi:ATP-binding protein, partial [Rapidithrix thailandica]